MRQPLVCLLLSILALNASFVIAGNASASKPRTTTAKSMSQTSVSSSTAATASPTGKISCTKQHSNVTLGIWYNYGPDPEEAPYVQYSVGVSTNATIKDRFGEQRPFLFKDRKKAPNYWDFWICTGSTIGKSSDSGNIYYGQWTPTRRDGRKGNTCLTVATNDVTTSDQRITLSRHCDIDSLNYTGYNTWSIYYYYLPNRTSPYLVSFDGPLGFVGADPDAIPNWYNSVSPTKLKGHYPILNQYDDSYVPDDDRRRGVHHRRGGRHAKREDYSDDAILLFEPKA